jgi:hypothetical protein
MRLVWIIIGYITYEETESYFDSSKFNIFLVL